MAQHSMLKEFLSTGYLTLIRFPITILLVAVITASIVYGFQIEDWPSTVLAIMVGGTVGVLSSLIIHLAIERYKPSVLWRSLLWFLLVVLIVVNYVYWKSVIDQDRFDICSAVLYSGSLVLLTLILSMIPYLSKNKETQSLLTFNREVFISYVFSALLAFILFAALSLALLAIDNLFDVNIPGKTYAHLITIIGGVVWTLLFLSGVPNNFHNKDIETYPAFRIIIQFIGVPVIVVYALILLFYALKNVIWTGTHEEWTLWLILWFYLLSFLFFCLNYSIKDDNNHKWSAWFCKWYLIGAIPISALNLISSWKTISNYGVTELSYIIATFSLFLLVVALYLLLSQKKDFRVIPGLLFIMTFISVLGPLNMCSTSIRSQVGKLTSTFSSSGMLSNGVLTPAENLTSSTHRDINGHLQFLANRGSLGVLKKLDVNNLLGDEPLVIEEVMMALNIENRRNTSIDNTFIQGERYNEIDVGDYTKVIPVLSPFIQDEIPGLHIKFAQDESMISIIDGSRKIGEINYSRFLDLSKLKADKFLLIENDKHKVKVYFTFMDIDDNRSILNIEGIALYQNKK